MKKNRDFSNDVIFGENREFLKNRDFKNNVFLKKLVIFEKLVIFSNEYIKGVKKNSCSLYSLHDFKICNAKLLFKKMYYFFSRPLVVEDKKTNEKIEPKKVEDKKTNEKMVEREDPKRAADIKTVKAIKQLMLQMVPLYGPAQYCDEAALMCDLLADQIEKFEIMTLTDEEIVKLLNEED